MSIEEIVIESTDGVLWCSVGDSLRPVQVILDNRAGGVWLHGVGGAIVGVVGRPQLNRTRASMAIQGALEYASIAIHLACRMSDVAGDSQSAAKRCQGHEPGTDPVGEPFSPVFGFLFPFHPRRDLM